MEYELLGSIRDELLPPPVYQQEVLTDKVHLMALLCFDICDTGEMKVLPWDPTQNRIFPPWVSYIKRHLDTSVSVRGHRVGKGIVRKYCRRTSGNQQNFDITVNPTACVGC